MVLVMAWQPVATVDAHVGGRAASISHAMAATYAEMAATTEMLVEVRGEGAGWTETCDAVIPGGRIRKAIVNGAGSFAQGSKWSASHASERMSHHVKRMTQRIKDSVKVSLSLVSSFLYDSAETKEIHIFITN